MRNVYITPNKTVLVQVSTKYVYVEDLVSPPGPNYVLSGAGSVVVNGDYYTEGTFNSKPYYKHDTNTVYILFSLVFNQWLITGEIGDVPPTIYYSNGAGASPSNPWSTLGGINPPPTLI